MTYFDDADQQPMPLMFDEVSWETMKDTINAAVEDYNKNLL